MLYGLVVDQEERTGQNAKVFWQIRIRSNEGLIKCMMWDAKNPVNNPDYPQKGDLIRVDQFKDQRNTKNNNIIIEQFTKVVVEDIPEDYLAIIRNIPGSPSKEDINRAATTIIDANLYNDKAVYHFVNRCLAALPLAKFFKCPAAQSMHHNWEGGLVIHTAEMINIAKGIVENYRKIINPDVVFAAITLHDVGKVKTYSLSELGIAQSLPIERTIGHIFYSMNLIQQTYQEGEFPYDVFHDILHAVAAHHGSPEHGSVKEMMTMEAQIVHAADMISSRDGIIMRQLWEKKVNNSQLGPELSMSREKYYVTEPMRAFFESLKQ